MTTAVQSQSPAAIVGKNAGSKEPGFRKASNAPKSQHQTEYERKMSEYDGRMSYLRSRLDELKGTYSGGSGNEGGARGRILDEIRKVRDQAKPVQDQRRVWIKEATELREALKKRSGELNAAKEKLPFKSVPEIEAKIAAYETQLESGNFKLSEEKQIVAEISKLNKARRSLQTLDGNGSDVLSLKARLDAVQEKINGTDSAATAFKEQLDTLSEKLAAAEGARSAQKLDRAERQAQIEKLRTELDSVYEAKKKLFEENRAYRQAAYEARLKRETRIKEERRVEELEEKIAELEEKLQSYNPESLIDRKLAECQNLIAFFTQLTATSQDAGASQVNGNKPASSLAAPVGRSVSLSEELANAVVIKKDDEDAFFVGAGSKKKGHKKAAGASTVHNEGLGKLAIHVLAGLSDLNLAIPSTQSQVPLLLEALEKIKGALVEKKASDASGEAELDPKQKALMEQIAALKLEIQSKPEETEGTQSPA